LMLAPAYPHTQNETHKTFFKASILNFVLVHPFLIKGTV
jgi:hypothetical protein